MKKKIITIAGLPGSGKSTTAKKVAERLGYDHFSSGDLFRAIAAEHGLSVAELNLKADAAGDDSIDFEVDEKLRKIGENGDTLVIDSRTAFHWIPSSFKVYLSLDPNIAAERVYKQIRVSGRASQTASNVEEVRLDIETRKTSELARYGKLYGLDYTETAHYDLVLDSNGKSVEEIAALIVEKYQSEHLS